MMRFTIMRQSIILVSSALFLMWPAESGAQNDTLTLHPSDAFYLEDTANTVFFTEQGDVSCPDNTLIGKYIATRRMGVTTDAASEIITLSFLGKLPAQNITLQGAMSTLVGESTGGVSAASAQFSKLRKRSYSAKLAGGSPPGWVMIEKLGTKGGNPCP